MAQAKGRPMGYRFHPTNTELMKYLLGFARNKPLSGQNQLIQHVDLYADKEPWEIVQGANSTKTHYFITPHKKHDPRWKRFSRCVGKNGTWKPQGKRKEVFDYKGRLIGYVKSLKYNYGKSEIKNANGEWLMTEYSLYDGYLNAGEIEKKGYVICKIKKKGKAIIDDDNEISMNDNDVDDFINSILQEDDINVGDYDVGDAGLAIINNGECFIIYNGECLEGSHPPLDDINLEDIDFV